jgi:uncharacterized small protein (TIGR04563 family)
MTVWELSRKQKVNLYLPAELIAEIDAMAKRLDRSRGWVVQRAWALARASLEQLPSVSSPKER